MLKSLLLSFVFGFSACTIASETKSATKPFTNEQLGNIEYTVKFSYIPKEDDSLYGFIKGKPVKIIEQHFILDFKDGSRKVTRLIGNDKDKNLGLTNIEKFVPDTNTNLKTVNITMRDEKKLIIDNLTNFNIKTSLTQYAGRILTFYTIEITKKYKEAVRSDCVLSKVQITLCDPYSVPFEFQQRVTLGSENPKFSSPEVKGDDLGLFIELEAIAVPKK